MCCQVFSGVEGPCGQEQCTRLSPEVCRELTLGIALESVLSLGNFMYTPRPPVHTAFFTEPHILQSTQYSSQSPMSSSPHSILHRAPRPPVHTAFFTEPHVLQSTHHSSQSPTSSSPHTILHRAICVGLGPGGGRIVLVPRP